MTNHTIEPHPVLVRVAKAVHEHLCRRNIMQYLANDEDCEGVARAVLLSLREPQNDAWDGLARQLIMWMDMEPKTPRALFRHLKASGYDIPQWLRDEPEMQNLDHVPSKGTRAMLAFTAMINTIIGESA